VVVYDAAGAPVFSPYAATASGGDAGSVVYRFPSSGLYIIGLLHDWKLVETHKITITK
jgi:hypothetical protein